jgi:hypothetical protein
VAGAPAGHIFDSHTFSNVIEDAIGGGADGNTRGRVCSQIRRVTHSKFFFTLTLDGIHVAVADLHGATEFVSTELNMRGCAAAIGLAVYP